MIIGGRHIGPSFSTYIIAEMSANHNQSFDSAIEIVRAAKEAGADAVKLQTYKPETMTLDSSDAMFRTGATSLWQGRSLFDLYGEAQTPWEWHAPLKREAERLGLHLFSTPFDSSSVELLEGLDVPCYKIASFELTDIPLVRQVAATNKPMIMSTGMATLEEIMEAVDAATGAGAASVALLKCTSAYPAQPSDMHLKTIPDLAQRFGVPVGLSDHTLGIAVPVAAVALGACIIEKHFTLSRSTPGPDSAFSLEPAEFRAMVDAVRIAEQAVGEVRYDLSDAEMASRAFRRSLFVVEDVEVGEAFTRANVRAIRPGDGLAPKFLDDVLTKRAACKISRGTPLAMEHLR